MQFNECNIHPASKFEEIWDDNNQFKEIKFNKNKFYQIAIN